MAFMSTMVPPSSPFMRAVECIEPAGRTGEGKRTSLLMISTMIFGALRRDHHLGAVGPGAVPALDRDVVFDVHKFPRQGTGPHDHKAKLRQNQAASRRLRLASRMVCGQQRLAHRADREA